MRSLKPDRWVPSFIRQLISRKKNARKKAQTTLDLADYCRKNELAHDLRRELTRHGNIKWHDLIAGLSTIAGRKAVPVIYGPAGVIYSTTDKSEIFGLHLETTFLGNVDPDDLDDSTGIDAEQIVGELPQLQGRQVNHVTDAEISAFITEREIKKA